MRLIQLPKISDARGNLTFIEEHVQIPFSVKRVYYLYDIPAAADRGGHAHIALEQFVIPLSGSFEMTLDDGCRKETFLLKKPWEGLYISPLIWRELKDFSAGAVCLVLASDYYDEQDYIRDYEAFLKVAKNQ